MRIRSKSSSERRRRWPAIKSWLRSRRMGLQLLLAFSLGTIVAGGGGLWYVKSGKTWIATLTAPLHAEAQKTIEEVTVTNDLPTLYFDIGFAEFQTLAAQREEALQKGVLLQDDDDWMRAQIRFQGETISVRLRLKGDWPDHLEEKKWSFRVKTRNDATLLGMRSFSVQAPYTRSYLNEWLYYEDLRRAGILAPRYSFVNVVVNGENWGLYALEENFSKELLESQGRREGVIVRFNENLLWKQRALYIEQTGHWYNVYGDVIAKEMYNEAFAQVDDFNSIKIAADPLLREQSETALGLLQGFQSHQLLPSEVFDADLMGRYLAHTSLWAAHHSTIWHNERYYYNPLTSRLEPIAYDALPLYSDPIYRMLIDLKQYGDLEVVRAYAQEVLRISQPEYLEEFKAAYLQDFEHYQEILSQEFPPGDLAPPWGDLAERQGLLRASLRPRQTVYVYQNGGMISDTVDLQVGNILNYPVVLQQLQIGERTVNIQPAWLRQDGKELLETGTGPEIVLKSATGQLRYVSLQIPTTIVNTLLPEGTQLYSHTVQLVTKMYGVDDSVVVDVLPHYPPLLSQRVTPVQPTVTESLARHPFLMFSGYSDYLRLKPGTWAVSGDLVLPDGVGLTATRATTLTFEREALFFANAPLLLSAPEGEEIRLLPQEESWAGLVVLQAGEEPVSLLQRVVISGTAGISRAGWMTTGGVTFSESPVILLECRLQNSFAEDALNIMRSEFEIRDTEFADSASDAFDGDFVHGTIENCVFRDIRGDGIDISGSTVHVAGVHLLRIHDKGISAGEASTLSAERVHASEVAIAVASKDLSQVTISDVTITEARVAGFAAYKKKMEYGPARIAAYNVNFTDASQRTLAQTGSNISIDGVTARTVDLDIDIFYRRLEILSSMQELNYHLGPAIDLVGSTLLTPEVQAGDSLVLSLYWRANASPELDYTIFVHVLDAAGNFVTQEDTMPADGAAPTSRWKPGEFVEDFHSLTLPEDMPPGEYHILVGMYDFQTGARLPVTTPEGEELLDAIIRLQQTFTVVE